MSAACCAPRALKEARAKHAKGEITRRAASRDRGPRDREDHQEAGGGRAASSRPTASSAARGGSSISTRASTASRCTTTGKGIVFAGVETKAESDARHRQGRLLRPSACRAFQVPQGAHQGHAEDDHPGAEHAALPPGPADRSSKQAYPDLDAYLRRSRQGLPQGDPRVLRRRLPLSADGRHRLVDDVRSEGARAFARARRRPGQAAGELRRDDQQGAGGQARRHGDHRCTPAAATSARPSSPRAATSSSPSSCSATTKLDGYFLEYDTDRAGGFEPLRFLPKGKKIVVLGLVTSKSGKLESKDAIKRRIDEATKYVALDQLCLSPQCGFASTEEGNVLAEDEQWAKLRMIVELADEVWGRPGWRAAMRFARRSVICFWYARSGHGGQAQIYPDRPVTIVVPAPPAAAWMRSCGPSATTFPPNWGNGSSLRTSRARTARSGRASSPTRSPTATRCCSSIRSLIHRPA